MLPDPRAEIDRRAALAGGSEGVRRNPVRELDACFLAQVTSWLERDGEIVVVARYLVSGGQRHYALCHSASDVERLLQVVADGTELVVVRGAWLPLRGSADSELIQRGLSGLPDGVEYLLLDLETTSDADPRAAGVEHTSLVELRDEVRALGGRRVAVGPCPPWHRGDEAGSIVSAIKGGIDGPRA